MCTVGFSLNPRRSHSNTFKAAFINNSYKMLKKKYPKLNQFSWNSIFQIYTFINHKYILRI